MSSSVAIADVELDVSGDTNYAVYFTKDDFGIQDKIALLNISDGATVENHYSVGVDNDTCGLNSVTEATLFLPKYAEKPLPLGMGWKGAILSRKRLVLKHQGTRQSML